MKKIIIIIIAIMLTSCSSAQMDAYKNAEPTPRYEKVYLQSKVQMHQYNYHNPY